MQFSLSSFLQQHDLRLVILAAFICALASLCGVSMAERAARSTGRRRLVWVVCAAIAVGFGIWTTHFIAMLAYDPGFLLEYELFGTALSLLIAVVFTGGGVAVCSRGRHVLGGGIVGLGIALMHYIGMNAISVGGEVVWRQGIVAASVLIAAVMAAGAFWHLSRGTGRGRQAFAAVLLTLAICGLHFTGMAALNLEGCFSVATSGERQTTELIYAVVLTSLLATSVALFARFVDARDERRDLLEASRLHELANVAVEGLLTSRDDRILSCNKSLMDLTGAGVGGDLTALIPPGFLAQLREAPGTSIGGEIIAEGGLSIPVEASLRYLQLEGGFSEAVALRDIRQRLAMEAEAAAAVAAVVASEERLRLLIQGVTDYAIYMLDRFGHVANWNVGAERAKGYTADEIVGQHFSRFFSDEDRASGVPQRALDSALRDGKFEAEGWRFRKDGTRFWASVLIEPIRNEHGVHVGFAKITHDNTLKRQAEDRLADTRRNLELALGNMSQGLALFDAEGALLIANDRISEVLSLSGGEAFDHRTLIACLADHVELGAASRPAFILGQQKLLEAGQDFDLSHEMRDGRTLRIVHRPVPQVGWLCTCEDITERRQSEQRIVHLSRHDALTGLPNRVSFVDTLNWALDGAADVPGQKVAVLGIDLDRFKEVNDHLGHSVGDAVLKAVGQRIRDVLTGDEFAARFGGDEFAAMIAFSDPAELHGFVQRLDAALSAHLMINDHDILIGGSIGVAIYPDDAVTVEKLIANADMAMYRAKASLSETVCFYQAEMDEAARERQMLARALWSAVGKDEFHLHYQIQKSVSTGATTGYEVLLRWQHPEKGNISPADFIPIAEECGAIVPIGEWVLRAACREAATWSEDIRIAVNLSPVQLANATLPDLVADVLAETGLDPSRLELEVTESAIISDKARALQVLRRIKALGVSIAIDDFGTGYSSLDTLRSFPFDKIKLDRSFMREVETSKQAKAIIRAILALGRSLQVPVLAEGVETSAQLELLRAEGCDEAQGYLLGRPRPIELRQDRLAI